VLRRLRALWRRDVNRLPDLWTNSAKFTCVVWALTVRMDGAGAIGKLTGSPHSDGAD
jgi:hypothetical protein